MTPFAISPQAERLIREELGSERTPEMEPALVLTLRSTAHDRHGKLIEYCDRVHYGFGYSPPSKHAGDTYVDLFGHRVAIDAGTLASLAGKRLIVGRTDPVDGVSYTREILLASDDDVTQKA